MLLAGFEPEDESPIIFLRLRKAARKSGIAVYSLAPVRQQRAGEDAGTLLPTVPGGEATPCPAWRGARHGSKPARPAR